MPACRWSSAYGCSLIPEHVVGQCWHHQSTMAVPSLVRSIFIVGIVLLLDVTRGKETSRIRTNGIGGRLLKAPFGYPGTGHSVLGNNPR